MKTPKIAIIAALLTLCLLIKVGGAFAVSVITVSGSNGKDANYTSLTKAGGAFAALNSITQVGKTITITITADVTDEDGATALTGAAGMWTTLTINPSGGAARIISGSVAKPLIDLSGADNVTINGLNSGGNSLTISNLSTSNTDATSTIRFFGSATSNTVKYCTLKGSSTATSATKGGVLYFGLGDNSTNTIDHNNITNSDGIHRPVAAIYSYGGGGINSGNIISNNNIYDFFNPGANSQGIFIYDYSSDWTITGNNFYETSASFAPTGAFTYDAIRIEGISMLGNNFTVSDNFIGGSAADHTGTLTFNSAFTHLFHGIYLGVGATTASSVQNNTIQSIAYTTTSGEPFNGIRINGGNVNIGTVTGNIIGLTTGNGSITLTNSTANAISYGIYNRGTGIVDIENNKVGAITIVGSATIAHSFYAIRSDYGTNTISTNTIGSTGTANSINARSTSSSNSQSVYGIYAGSTGTTTISGNTIANLTNASTYSNGEISGINSSAGTRTISNNTVRDLTIANSNTESVSGIYFSCSIAVAQSITGNTIYNLSNTYPSFAGKVTGLYYLGPTTASNVSGNFIHDLSVTGATSASASIYGIRIGQGSTTFSNNIISLGGDTKTSIYGILEIGAASTNNNLYFNTVYIGGTPASGSNTSYALYSAATTNTRNFRNNILNNVRSTAGGTSLHYAAYLNYSASTNLTLNNNDYYAPGTGGVLGYASGNILVLPLIAGLDANSSPTNPVFVTPGGTTAANYLPQSTALVAATGTSVLSDYAGTTRSLAKPSMGAYEYTVTGALTVTASVGPTTAGYSTLKAAFDAIDAGTHQGDISIAINSSITETASAVLHQSGYNGTSSYSTIHIYPTVTGLIINGNLAAPLIDLNGADAVNIDGRVGGTGSIKDLTISNTATASASTIRFLADATSNTVQYCTIQGSNTTTTSGTLFFSTGTTSGNDGNTITNNTITSAGSNLPLNAIYSAGTSTSADNSGISITNNNIQDYSGASANGIYVVSNSSAWTITGNRFFQSASRSISGTQRDINIVTASGGGYTVNNNIIGYSSASGTGTSTFTGSANLVPIGLTVAASPASEIQGNTITAISFSTSATTASGSGIFSGISIFGGTVNIGTSAANTIGVGTGNGTIAIIPSASTPAIQGIYATSTGTVSIQSNIIGGISINSAATIGSTFYGINTAGTAGNFAISGNTIGSTTTTNSIAVGKSGTTTTGVCTFYGVNQAATGAATITGNTIQ